jgi:hypothetical protein
MPERLHQVLAAGLPANFPPPFNAETSFLIGVRRPRRPTRG